MSEREQLITNNDIDDILTSTLHVAQEESRNYINGTQRPITTREQRDALGERAARDQVDNILRQCAEELAGRLIFERIGVESDDERLVEFLDTLASKNSLAKMIFALFIRAQTDGNAAAIVSWHPEQNRPLIIPHAWHNGKTNKDADGVYIYFDAYQVPSFAVRDWRDDTAMRRTVYTDSVITTYRKTEAQWQLLERFDTRKADGTPIGIPVAHFPNGVSPYSVYGQSTVQPLLGQQDALNGILFDIAAAAAFTAMPVFTGTGVEETSDVSVGPGTMFRSMSPDARFGSIPAGSMQGLLDARDAFITSISSKFPVPSYRIGSGDFPSGLALQRADSPMIARAKQVGNIFAPSVIMLAHRATEMQNVYGGDTLDEENLLHVQWAPPDQVDPGTQAELDQARVDIYEALERLTPTLMGKTRLLTADEVDAVQAEREAMTRTLAEI